MALMRDLAYQAILDEIIGGHLQPGDQIFERSIAARLAMSTTPVKEALRRLENEQFVSAVPRSGVFVSDTAITSVQDVVIARAWLEGLASRLAAERWAAGETTASERTSMEMAVEEMTRLTAGGSIDQVAAANAAFHDAVRRLSGNRPIVQFVGILLGVDAALRRRILSDASELSRGLEEHLSVHQAIVQGDADLAEERMRYHILRCAQDVVAALG